MDVLKVLLGIVVGYLLAEWRDYRGRKRDERGLGTVLTVEVWLINQMASKDIENTKRILELLQKEDGHPSLGRKGGKKLMPVYEANLPMMSIVPKEVLPELMMLHNFALSVSSRMENLDRMFEEFYSENARTSKEDLERTLATQIH